mmetsp:Transcript_7342/g.16701  ORF Transcript_7342/g.16701 Transcript_7342/m.16701 type:complete len:152 (+) Transcript_7342:280-735(+)
MVQEIARLRVYERNLYADLRSLTVTETRSPPITNHTHLGPSGENMIPWHLQIYPSVNCPPDHTHTHNTCATFSRQEKQNEHRSMTDGHRMDGERSHVHIASTQGSFSFPVKCDPCFCKCRVIDNNCNPLCSNGVHAMCVMGGGKTLQDTCC